LLIIPKKSAAGRKMGVLRGYPQGLLEVPQSRRNQNVYDRGPQVRVGENTGRAVEKSSKKAENSNGAQGSCC